MLLIVNNWAAIPDPSSIVIQYALRRKPDVVALDSQVPERGYLQGGLVDEDLFELEYITPSAYERVPRPISLDELVRTLKAFAGGGNWRGALPWAAMDQEAPAGGPAALAAVPDEGWQLRYRRRHSSHDGMRPLGCLAVLVGLLAFPLAVAGLVALDQSQYGQDISDFGTLVAALLILSLALYYYFGAVPLRRAAARWWGLLLDVTIVQDGSSKYRPWMIAERGSGRGWLVSLLDIATMAVLIFSPFAPLVLFVAAVKQLV